MSGEADELGIAPGEVIAKSGFARFATELYTSEHRWVSDEPVSVGGSEIGPGPYDLLLGALGACTVMTIKLVAARENIPLTGVRVRLRHDRNHERDCDHCTDADARVQAIFRQIAFEGELDQAQRERLMEIADKCPVHRTLAGNLHVHSVMV